MRKAGDKIARAELVKMLDAETWLSAEDSVKHGFADVVDEPVRAAALAQFDLTKFGIPVPKAIASAKVAIAEESKRRRVQFAPLANAWNGMTTIINLNGETFSQKQVKDLMEKINAA
jgi:hypothetical protein